MCKMIYTPLDDNVVNNLNAGDIVKINGTVYVARDAAHKRMEEMINRGEDLPFDVHGEIMYYMGPCPPKNPEDIIGSAGPTTSNRMDKYAPKLIELGLKGMIGKGNRCANVVRHMGLYNAVYFGAIGGAGALISRYIINQKVIAFEDLGTEAIREIVVKDFYAVVAIDSRGRNLYEFGPKRFNLT